MCIVELCREMIKLESISSGVISLDFLRVFSPVPDLRDDSSGGQASKLVFQLNETAPG